MTPHFDFFRHSITWPLTSEPAWAGHVERWYQLDAASFVLADAYWNYKTYLKDPPNWLILASPGASNVTDAQFAAAPASPAKFVHTLPNVRGVALLQLMKWSGQVVCLQKDPGTVTFALGEALRLAETEDTRVWVASVYSNTINEWTAEFYKVGREGHFQALPSTESGQTTRDAEWWKWLAGSNRKLVAEGFEIIKK